MIELDVQTRRKAPPSVSEYVARYLVLGDAIVVTEHGADVLCATPRELFEVSA